MNTMAAKEFNPDDYEDIEEEEPERKGYTMYYKHQRGYYYG